MDTPKYSVVIPTYNHLDDFLKPCLQSIVKYTNLNNTEVIVVANGCVDSTADYVRDLSNTYPSIKLINEKEGLGYTKATNIGIKASLGEYVVLLNNDTVLLIGPEGGFSNEEINMFERLNMAFVKLGNYTLRAETAMIASIFAIQNLLYPNK